MFRDVRNKLGKVTLTEITGITQFCDHADQLKALEYHENTFAGLY